MKSALSCKHHSRCAQAFAPFSSNRATGVNPATRSFKSCSGRSMAYAFKPSQAMQEGGRLKLQQASAGALAIVQACAALLAGQLTVTEPALAVLNSPNARIPRSPDAALRRWAISQPTEGAVHCCQRTGVAQTNCRGLVGFWQLPGSGRVLAVVRVWWGWLKFVQHHLHALHCQHCSGVGRYPGAAWPQGLNNSQ